MDKWTPEDVWERIVAAANVERALPDPESRFRVPHSGGWPGFPSDPEESYGYNDVKVRVAPAREAIDGMSQVWEWLDWLALPPKRALFLLAAGVPAKKIARKLGVNRSTVWRMKQRALKYISDVLNKTA